MASSSYLHPANSSRTRFTREGFQPLPANHGQNGINANDATIDIPLEPVQSTASTRGFRNGSNSTAAPLQPSQSMRTTNTERRKFFRGRRTKPDISRSTGRVGEDGEEDTLTTMGKLYRKLFGFSVVTRYLFYVVPLGVIIAVPIVVGAIITGNHPNNPPLLAGVPIVWFFTWIEIVWGSLWVSKLVAHFLPFVFRIFAGVVSSGVRKYEAVLRKLEIPLSLVGWAVTSLATFVPLMTQNPYNRDGRSVQKKWETIVQEILGAATVASLVYLAEKTFIQFISINYHRKQFNARIVDSKRHVYLLGLLYEASANLFPAYCPEFAEEDYIISDQLQLSKLTAIGKKNHKMHRRSGSATPLRLIQDVSRFGGKVTSAFGNVAQEITGKEVFHPNSAHSVVVEALERKASSEALARRIWMSFVMEGRDSLVHDDVLDVLGTQHHDEADEAFWALDRDLNGDVSLEEMVMTVVEWGRERKAIANSMVDVAQAIGVLDTLLLTVVTVAVVFIFIAFLNRDFVTTLATTGTALLSLSFVFSVTAQEVLGSCIFLFVKHPFDVGDRVDVALTTNQFVVEHISLLFTVFRRVSGPCVGQICQYPNIVLNTLAIDNISRSKAMTEQVTVNVSYDTSFEDIQILKNEMKNFVTDPSNSRDFQPDIEVEVLGTSDLSNMQLRVEVRHKSNWSNETLRAARRSKFMCALIAALRAVPIDAPGGGGDAAGSAANPNYSVAISDSEAKQNAQSSSEARAKARLVPVTKVDEVKDTLSPVSSNNQPIGMTGLTARDAAVINSLTAVDPTSDPTRDEAWTSGRDDSSTLADRPDINPSDLDEVRGLLRRASTRGKRRPTDVPGAQAPSVPTISEPIPGHAVYDTAYDTAYRQQTAYNPSGSALYSPPSGGSAPTTLRSAAGNEMRQMSRGPGGYGGAPENVGQKPSSPTTGSEDDNEKAYEDMEPYSRV